MEKNFVISKFVIIKQENTGANKLKGRTKLTNKIKTIKQKQ